MKKDTPTMPGYTGQIARVDLSTGAVTRVPTENYSPDLIGGQGIAAKIYWDEVLPEVGAFDPENRLIFSNGPCSGFRGLAAGRWVICGKSPETDPEFFSHCNLGGTWGAGLKAAGFDALVVQGKADKPVYLLIEDGVIKISDASNLRGRGPVQVQQILKAELGNSLTVVSTGPAGENMTALANIVADNDSSGTGGLGGVMGSKNLKAVAVRGSGKAQAARPERLRELLELTARLRIDFPISDSGAGSGGNTDHCADCTDECNRGVYQAKDGTRGKFMCQSASFYKEWATKYYGQPGEVPFRAVRLADHYSVNTKSIAPILSWLDRCHHAGILTEKNTGLPLDKMGSMEFLQTLFEDISYRRGFGEVLARGLPRAAASLGSQAQELTSDDINQAGERMTYVPKAYITTGILYAVESRQPIQQLHEIIRPAIQWVRWAKKQPNANLSSTVFRGIAKRFWGSELGADFSTYEGKALAAKKIQDRQLAKECLIVCDSVWPMTYVEHSPDHVGDSSLESKIFSAISGRDTTEEELYRVGERVVNLQRAILAREGHRGRGGDTLPEACFTVPLDSERLNDDCIFPGKDGEIFSRKGALFDREKFQAMLGEFYELRGWDPETGLQTKSKLADLGIADVARDLAARGLLSQ